MCNGSPSFLIANVGPTLQGVPNPPYTRGLRMKLNRFLCALFALLFAISNAPITRADEGMWTFNNVPRSEIKQRYGFEITDAWLKRVQLASVRFNSGGSGSFVSPHRLGLANHHVAPPTRSQLSTPPPPLFQEGFFARTRAAEAKGLALGMNALI